MGGIIAIQLALKHPELITHLVLVAVGRHLNGRIPRARLIILPGGEHSMGMDLPETLAPEIEAFLMEPKKPDMP